MVEENFEFWTFEIIQIGFILPSNIIYLLHHGWRKFWNLTFWNSPDWLDLLHILTTITT